ncbi:putative phosphoesterase, related to the Icc protein [Archaeoglobus sulfaticallidus PM70-1]|uniref:Putative phosphoesterase, related to the Icc protein n=1 Tax=Archaeoglobus sulfaticallidus PM70-1 TaxID=387631 RepID=N0BKK4_9EURY|nr:metallophosphoesterase family protein [Archaeoglobus sulfaticallidus]AGK60735.1 putative phosphoesterase, related to the Icc protein [Archaeoglobus sulfaticallidus PM70-1]
MRVLILSDIHSRFDVLKRILESVDVDCCFICGDLSDFRAEDVFVISEILSEVGLKCYCVHGNCDPEEAIDYIEQSGMINLHCKSLPFENYTLHGVGGSNYTPFLTPSEYSNEEMWSFVENFIYGERNILISHCPPKGILDMTYSGINAGCEVIRSIMEKFDYIFCGHIHEAKGMYKNGTLVLNPGSVISGSFAVWDMNSNSFELKNVKDFKNFRSI